MDVDMWRLPYYHGLLPRQDVVELLPNDGDFLVRTTEETSGAGDSSGGGHQRGVSDEHQRIKEFMNEARIMRQLDHPNVIRFHGVAVGQEPLMIVMELASDGSLTDYLKTQRRSARTKLFMCVGAAAGLTHIHSKGIIHCDVAARNCLYTDGVVKISDFGMATKALSKQLESGAKLPVKWMSPDALTDHFFTQKDDTWAFGVLCWEVFTNGETPFAEMRGSVILAAVTNGYWLEFPNDAPLKFVEFVMQHIWDPKRNNRYSMGAVYDWLKRQAEG